MAPSKFAPELTYDQWKALSTKERCLRRLAHYCDKVHVQEDFPHNNRGEQIDAWTKLCKAALGSPWCVIALFANLLESGADRSKLPDNLAGTHALLEWAKANGRVTKQPHRGDWFVIIFDSRSGHAGAYVEDMFGGKFRSIEGNTNDEGSREGYEMARRERSYRTPNIYFINMDHL